MTKQELRAQIKLLKKKYTKEQLARQSEHIIADLEKNIAFTNANIVMIYHSLPDEVQTTSFIAKWRNFKRLVLPTVIGDDIIPVELTENTDFAVGDFNILEPQNEPYNGTFDLIIVPGVAFDSNGNRLGRGRGYYDRFLSRNIDVKRIGLCFDFQFVDSVPTEINDIQMDEVISGKNNLLS